MKKAMKIMKKIGFGFLMFVLFVETILVCDMIDNYFDYRNSGFDPETAAKWAFETTENDLIKPINNWLEKKKSKESEVLEFPMIIQSIQGNTLINEFRSGR